MRRLLVFIGIGIFLVAFEGSTFGFWLWSSKKPEFVRPEEMTTKGTPEEQLAWALAFYEAKDYERAIHEMGALVRQFPRSKEASEGQFYLGRAYEGIENYVAAFKAYEEVIKKYPNSSRIQEIIEYEYRIANLFYSGKKRKVIRNFGPEILPSYQKAVEIYTQVIQHAPYGPYAELSQYKIGQCYKKIEDYEKAREAFEKLIKEYPRSELKDDAKYQIALVTFHLSRDASYDVQATDQAIAEFSKFVEEHPESELVQESLDAVKELENRKAEKSFEIASFYDKQGHLQAAIVYYNKVIEEYSESVWAERALERVTVLKKKETSP